MFSERYDLVAVLNDEECMKALGSVIDTEVDCVCDDGLRDLSGLVEVIQCDNACVLIAGPINITRDSQINHELWCFADLVKFFVIDDGYGALCSGNDTIMVL